MHPIPVSSAWRDPVAFVPLEALIEYGLADVPQIEIRPCQLKNALKCYGMKHPGAAERLLNPPPIPEDVKARRNAEAMAKLRGGLLNLSRSLALSREERQAIARRAVATRWGSPQGSR